jgi:ribonuclease Z
MHSTAKEAATIALKKVKHLILGHYSTRYEDISLLKGSIFSRGAIS